MRSFLALLIGLIVGALGCAEPHGHPLRGSTPGTPAIDTASIHLLDLEGKPHDFAMANGEAITVAVFTCMDCPISNRYAPAIRELYETCHGRGVDFYLIYVDPRDEPEAIRAHLKEYEYPCPALRDPKHTLVAATGATVTPEAVVFDANRKIVYRGRIDDRNADFGQSRSAVVKHDLADAIEATLAGRPVADPVTKAVGCYIADLKK